MARHKLTEAERARGYQKLLRSSSKRAAGLKAYARKWLREHGYSAAIVLLTLFLIAAPMQAQRSNVVYVDQLRSQSSTVGGMATIAQGNCPADTAQPCILIFDSILAAFPLGSLPTPCTQCLWISYMTIGQVQVATNTAPAFAQAWPSGVSFPLLFPNGTCGSAPSIAPSAAPTIGFYYDSGNGVIALCSGASERLTFSGNIAFRNNGILCWGAGSPLPCDTGLSRGAADEVDCGNGTAADKTCTFKAAAAVFTGNVTVGSCTGCGTGIANYDQSGFCSGVATASSTLGFFGLGAPGAVQTCTAGVAASGERVSTRAATIVSLNAKSSAAGVNASSGVFTVRKNGVSQTMTCTIGTGTGCSTAANPVSLVAGDTYGVQFTTQTADTLANLSVSLGIQ